MIELIPHHCRLSQLDISLSYPCDVHGAVYTFQSFQLFPRYPFCFSFFAIAEMNFWLFKVFIVSFGCPKVEWVRNVQAKYAPVGLSKCLTTSKYYQNDTSSSVVDLVFFKWCSKFMRLCNPNYCWVWSQHRCAHQKLASRKTSQTNVLGCVKMSIGASLWCQMFAWSQMRSSKEHPYNRPSPRSR